MAIPQEHLRRDTVRNGRLSFLSGVMQQRAHPAGRFPEVASSTRVIAEGAMSQSNQHFYRGFRFLRRETNTGLEALRAKYEVRLIETRHAIDQDGWVTTESGRMISRQAGLPLDEIPAGENRSIDHLPRVSRQIFRTARL
jgi:hypothetical protein